jgi:hypothetical protein
MDEFANREDREEYRKNVRSFADALRASLAAKRGLTIEDLQKPSEEAEEGEGEGATVDD